MRGHLLQLSLGGSPLVMDQLPIAGCVQPGESSCLVTTHHKPIGCRRAAPGWSSYSRGDDVAVVVVVVIGPVAHRICLNCSRITPVSVGSSLSVSGILSRPGTT